MYLYSVRRDASIFLLTHRFGSETRVLIRIQSSTSRRTSSPGQVSRFSLQDLFSNMKTFQVSAVFSRFFFCRYFSLYRFRAIVSCCPFNLEVLHIFIVSPLRPSAHTAQRQFGESFTALSGSLAYTKVFQVLKVLFSSG